jgi:hypothetical protein
MRVVEFHRFLDGDNALRAQFALDHGKVSKFVVQLECRFLEADVFMPVVRYDTAHGFAHCDRLHPYDKSRKITMYTQDYNEALTFSMNDLVTKWHAYRRRFEEWLRKK